MRILAGMLLPVLMLVMLSGCAEIKLTHPLGNHILLEINDVQCSVGTGVLRLLEAMDEYRGSADDVLWIRTIGETTLAEYVKNTVKDDMLRYTSAQVMARDLTVFITDDERSALQAEASELLNRLSGQYDVNGYFITLDDAVDLLMKRLYYNKVYEKLSENISMEISEADMKAIKISYVFIPVEAGIDTVERMRAAMKNGDDFSHVCEGSGYEPVLNIMETKGEMPEAFENSAYALNDNEISEIVETPEGYYIIYCLEDYMVAESIANRNRIISDGKRERFNDAYERFADTAKMRFNSAEWDKIDINSIG